MKNKVLMLFKYPHGHWNIPVIKRFSNYYDVESIYISEIKNKNFTETVNEINNLIKLKNVEIVVFDVDYFKFINFFFIEKISCKKKIFFTGDDFELHEMNSITASACDLVLSGCPLSVLKYKEKGYSAYFIPYENDKIIDEEQKKEIDVIFFGELTQNRKELLKYISENGINLKNVGFESSNGKKLSDNELEKLISKSKIVLNLSKSRSCSSVNNYSSENTFKYYYQHKGRVWDSGSKGVLCVSEYSPANEIFFKEDEIPTFSTKEDCVKILRKLLSDEKLLNEYTRKFTLKAKELINDQKNFEPIYNAIEKADQRRVKLYKFPYWYLRIAAKQVILKNIKLSTLIKAITQFNLIFTIIKNSSTLTKVLIVIESMINILWYTFAFTFKHKK